MSLKKLYSIKFYVILFINFEPDNDFKKKQVVKCNKHDLFVILLIFLVKEHINEAILIIRLD